MSARFQARIKSTGTWWGVWDTEDEAWQLGPWSAHGSEEGAHQAATVLNEVADQPMTTVETADLSVEISMPNLPPKPSRVFMILIFVVATGWLLQTAGNVYVGRWGDALLSLFSSLVFVLYGLFVKHQRRRWEPTVTQSSR